MNKTEEFSSTIFQIHQKETDQIEISYKDKSKFRNMALAAFSLAALLAFFAYWFDSLFLKILFGIFTLFPLYFSLKMMRIQNHWRLKISNGQLSLRNLQAKWIQLADIKLVRVEKCFNGRKSKDKTHRLYFSRIVLILNSGDEGVLITSRGTYSTEKILEIDAEYVKFGTFLSKLINCKTDYCQKQIVGLTGSTKPLY